MTPFTQCYLAGDKTRKGVQIEQKLAQRWLEAELIVLVETEETEADITILIFDATAKFEGREGA